MEVLIKCGDCKSELETWVESTSNGAGLQITIEPCYSCITEGTEQAGKEGFDEGHEEAELTAKYKINDLEEKIEDLQETIKELEHDGQADTVRQGS